MNRAIWNKAWRDALPLFLLLATIVYTFAGLYVWISNELPIERMITVIEDLPEMFRRWLPVEAQQLLSPDVRISLSYEHPLIVFSILIWAIARGSNAVSGQLANGTMEMTLAQPVHRLTVLIAPTAISLLGLALLCCATWLGTTTGIALVDMRRPVSSIRVFLPAASNLFSLGMFVLGLSTMTSAWDRYRGRSIAVVAVIYVISLIMKLSGEAIQGADWLLSLTFLSAYEPTDRVASGDWQYLSQDLLLIAMGAACLAVAALIFCRRDLPAPV